MKKLFFAAAACAALTFTACNNVPQANLSNSEDSLIYYSSYQQGSYLSQSLANAGVDSTNINDFIKGFMEGYGLGENKDKQAYMQGLMYGSRYVGFLDFQNKNVYGDDTTKTLSKENMLAGLAEGLKDGGKKLTMEAIDSIVRANDAVVKEKTFGDIKKANMDFLAANAKKEGVKTTASGLQYKVIKESKGALPKEGDVLNVIYTGKLIDGSEFDSSKGQTVPMDIRNVIPGFKEVLKMMPIGSKWEVYIPQELAYGSRSTGSIKPFSTLIFELEVVSVKADK